MTNVKYALARIRAQAVKDKTFRKELIEDPKKVLSTVLGQQLPDDLTINVIEEEENVATFLIPHEGTTERLYGASIESIVDMMEQASSRYRLGVGEGFMNTTDSEFCYSLLGGGCTVFGCDDIGKYDPFFFMPNIDMWHDLRWP